ncbi:MAG: hypothetical protein ACE5HD_05720 [Acidobacteriota bacterium]
MKCWASICLSVVLLWTFVPGMGELVENSVHLITAHHLAHDAPQGDEHAPLDREHGCTGTTHLCSCHVSQTFLVIQFLTHTAPPLRTSVVTPAHISSPRLLGSGIDHPPRA